MIRVNCRSILGVLVGVVKPQGATRIFKIFQVMQQPLEGISFNFVFVFIHYCIFFTTMSRSLYPINVMPAPDAVFVFIKISYKIFYNRFRVIRVSLLLYIF